MSMVLENVTPLLIPTATGQGKRKRIDTRRNRKRPYKARMSTKVKWALGDAMERTVAAQRRMKRLFDSFEEMRQASLTGKDVRMEMGQVEHELFGLALDVAELERIVTLAVAESKPAESKKAEKADIRI